MIVLVLAMFFLDEAASRRIMKPAEGRLHAVELIFARAL